MRKKMPTYTYQCLAEENSHGEFEEMHSINDSLEECPFCKKEGKSSKVQRLISLGGGFVLVGGGVGWSKQNYSG